MEERKDLFLNEKELYQFLFGVAYKITGNVMDSEDIVQDVLTSWEQIKLNSSIKCPKSYLARSVRNHSLNVIQRQERIRDSYIGMYLPSPIIKENYASLNHRYDLSYGFLVIPSKLNPLERSVFVLKESFELDYRELAEIIEVKEDYARQLYHRAAEKMKEARCRYQPDLVHKKKIFKSFIHAVTTGNLESLIEILKEDIKIYSDGGGKKIAALNPVQGALDCAKFIRGLYSKFYSNGKYSFRAHILNNCPALLIYEKNSGSLENVILLQCVENEIDRVFVLRNPEKIIQ